MDYLSYIFILWGTSVLLSLQSQTAPYGRYARSGWGTFVPGKFAWIVQELPSFAVPLLVLLYTDCPKAGLPLNQLALFLFLLHYFQRINVDISLTEQKKKNTSEVAYKKEFFRIKENFSNHYAVYTDGSKLEEKVAAAAYFPEHPDCSKATRLRDRASVFSAELEGIALALTEIEKLTKYHKNFVIYSDSLSALQAIQNKNFKVIDIRRLYNLIRKFPPYVHISFVWVPAHVGIQGNDNMNKLAKAALNRVSCSEKLIFWAIKT
ncbi:3-oxo-5-alpha-steroid 4-dehydrogenase 1 [Plakobranchus ocellatus]|uniref:3-oxo-5-alpha-steroid 4-dehydrogenase 1 n=1 Tax=Plakobranchus ocellatus TaxID=259542 RepID=A0AAV4B5G2_9GAST|nr:3-oxo-5-alpha-steroid 4-dehydrogenase 1 [Plakobranchus ocellatus]